MTRNLKHMVKLCAFQVMVGATVDLYCEDYWKKPKKDTWDEDK